MHAPYANEISNTRRRNAAITSTSFQDMVRSPDRQVRRRRDENRKEEKWYFPKSYAHVHTPCLYMVLKIKVVRPFYRLKYSYVIRSMNPTPRNCLLFFPPTHPQCLVVHVNHPLAQKALKEQEIGEVIRREEMGVSRNGNPRAM